MAITVGGVAIDLSADAAGIIREMDRAGRQVSAAARQMDTGFSRFQRTFAVAERGIVGGARRMGSAFAGFLRAAGPILGISAGAGFAGLTLIARRSLESADAIAKAADRAGIATDAYQELSFAASQTGVSQEALNTGLIAFGRRVAEARKNTGPLVGVLKKLNPELLRSLQASTNQSQALRILAEAIANTASEGERLALLQAAGSETFRQAVLLFREGAEGLDRYAARARELGLVIEEDLLRNAEDANDALDILQRVIGVRLTSAILEAAPEIQALATRIAEAIPSFAGAAKAAIDFGAAMIDSLVPRIQTTKKEIDALIAAYKALTDVQGAAPFGGISVEAAERAVAASAAEDFARLNDVMTDSVALFDQWRASAQRATVAAKEVAEATQTTQQVQTTLPQPFGGEHPEPSPFAGPERGLRAPIPELKPKLPTLDQAAIEQTTQRIRELEFAGRAMGFTMQDAFVQIATVQTKPLDALVNVIQQLNAEFLRAATSPFFDKIGQSVGSFLTEFIGPSSAVRTFGAGSIGAGTAELFGGFQHGGSFTVGGAGGPDTSLVAFRATPGERVDVTPRDELGSGRAGTIIESISIDARGADPTVLPRFQQALDLALAQHDAEFIDSTARDPRRRSAMNIKRGGRR